MADLKLFRNKDTGELVMLPEHFAEHPVFGSNLELHCGDCVGDECETDKVVSDNHTLPVEQRVRVYDNYTNDNDNDEEE